MEEISNISRLRPYQSEIACAVLDSYGYAKGLTFSVEIARQGGKNELSSHLEAILLGANAERRLNLIKCCPTFTPQALISMRRLIDRLEETSCRGSWHTEKGHIIRLGEARAVFLSAEPSANVVGNTAHLLLEIDEAQDVGKDKYNKEFRPMCAAYNTTTVLYGTTWDDRTLLEEVKQSNLELERRDGVRRHFRYDWEEVARYNPDYRRYVESERARLGENHPLFLTQYRLLPVKGGGGFFSPQQITQLQGVHPRLRRGEADKTYVAGIDLAGEAEDIGDVLDPRPGRDATVVTIAEVDFSRCDDLLPEPAVRVVEHYAWTGKNHAELYPRLVDICKNLWRCKRVVVDSTGLGEPVASFLRKALGSKVVPFRFTAESKSALGFGLLAAVNSGRLKVYKGDGSPEYQELMSEAEKATVQYRPSRTMNFFVSPSLGHDDFLMSLSLVVRAANLCISKKARGQQRENWY